jgi:hypothetical protein
VCTLRRPFADLAAALAKQKAKMAKSVQGAQTSLSNARFICGTPLEVVQQARYQVADEGSSDRGSASGRRGSREARKAAVRRPLRGMIYRLYSWIVAGRILAQKEQVTFTREIMEASGRTWSRKSPTRSVANRWVSTKRKSSCDVLVEALGVVKGSLPATSHVPGRKPFMEVHLLACVVLESFYNFTHRGIVDILKFCESLTNSTARPLSLGSRRIGDGRNRPPAQVLAAGFSGSVRSDSRRHGISA